MKFKGIFIACCIVLLMGLGMIVQNSGVSRTVDFRGEVIGIAESEEGVVTLFATSNEGQFLFRIDDRSRLEDCCGDEITAEDLTKGAIVQLNYRRYLFKDEDVHTVKDLVIFE